MYARTFPRRRNIRRALGVAAALLLLGMAGCGGSTGAGSDTATATNGTLMRPCDGPNGSVSDGGTVNLVLTPSSPVSTATPGDPFGPKEGSAHVGDIVQVQLPVTNRWDQENTTGGLTLLPPAAMLDAHAGVCFWNFKATAAGDATISIVGGALCAVNQPCPAYAILEQFVVHVS